MHFRLRLKMNPKVRILRAPDLAAEQTEEHIAPGADFEVSEVLVKGDSESNLNSGSVDDGSAWHGSSICSDGVEELTGSFDACATVCSSSTSR